SRWVLSENGAGKGRHRWPAEFEQPAERAPDRVRERLQIDPVEPPAEEPAAALLEQRASSGEVTVGQMLVSHRHLDQSLQRLAVVAARVTPEPLEQLMHLEEQIGVEQRRR